jgi:DNA-directed RNA polymerase beta subunit
MLRSLDGKPFDVLLNPLALPSRVNTSALFELALGKLAVKRGEPIKVSSYTEKGRSRLSDVMEQLQ